MTVASMSSRRRKRPGVQPAFVHDPVLLVHLQMVVSFIEGRSVSLEEIVLLAVECFRLRQHSIDFGKKTAVLSRKSAKITAIRTEDDRAGGNFEF